MNPSYTLECAFGTANPLTDPGAWTDITAYLRGFSTDRGRQHELSRTQAGYADIRLRNTDRRFDPVNTSGPYTPNVLPMRQIRLRATLSAVTYDLFRGFVEDWGQDWGGRPLNATGEAEAQVHAVDAFKVLSMQRIKAYRNAILTDAPIGYWPLDDALLGPVLTLKALVGDDLASTGSTAVSAAGPLLGGSPGTTANTFQGPSGIDAAFSLPGDATIEFWVNVTSVTTGDVSINAGGTNLAMLFLYNTGSPPQYLQWRQGNGNANRSVGSLSTGAWHHCVAVRVSGSISYYIDGVLDTVGSGLGRYTPPGALQVQIDWGANSFAHAAIYNYALSAEQIATHYAAKADKLVPQAAGTAIGVLLDAVGWPAGLRSIGTGLSTVALTPDGFALDMLQAIGEDTEHGLLFVDGAGKVTFVGRDTLEAKNVSVASFGDSGTDVGYQDLHLTYDDHDLWTEVAVSGADGTEVVVDDVTAQASYGVRTLTDAGLETVANVVVDHANGLLNTYKAPAFRPQTMKLGGTSTAAGATSSLKEQLSRVLGDLVTVKRTPPGGGPAISRTALIEGIKHSTKSMKLETEVALVPDFPGVPWILADTTYGVLGSTTDLGW